MINVDSKNGLLDKVVTWAALGLLGWNVVTTQQLSVDVAVLKNTVETGVADRYTASEASTRALLIDRRLDFMQREIEEVEDRVRSIENGPE